MRKIKILALMLVFVMMLSTVVACGSNTSQGENETSSEAITQSSKEETKAPEPTTSVESTTQEASTKREIVNYMDFEIKYSLYTVSDETKAMLIEKLSNLVLEEGQKFDMNSLTFKADETQAYNKMKSILVYVLSSDSDSHILECCNTRVELYKIDSKDGGMAFYFKRVNAM